jgi:hypothetical protein
MAATIKAKSINTKWSNAGLQVSSLWSDRVFHDVDRTTSDVTISVYLVNHCVGSLQRRIQVECTDTRVSHQWRYVSSTCIVCCNVATKKREAYYWKFEVISFVVQVACQSGFIIDVRVEVQLWSRFTNTCGILKYLHNWKNMTLKIAKLSILLIDSMSSL